LNSSIDPASDIAAVDRTLRARRTAKLLLAPERRAQRGVDWTPAHVAELETMIEGAAWAPFHKRASERARAGSELDAVMPWRFTVVQGQSCDELLDWLRERAESHPDSMWSRAWRSKIKDMLGACGALVQASWLPDVAEGESAATLSMGNVEHIAAAAAAVQNLLLAASARGWSSYWSSGGILREPEVFERLGMDAREALLGAIFLSPGIAEGATEIRGGLRDERGPVEGWVRWVPA